jgi:hypothetical protein
MTLKIVDHSPEVIKQIRALVDNQVLVGIPAEKGYRRATEDEPAVVNNALIGYLMEFGQPEMNIPARPHLYPGVEKVKNKIAEHFKKAAVAALEGNVGSSIKALHAAGLIAQNSVRNEIQNGGHKALAYSTVLARARRGRAGAIKEIERRKDPNGGDIDDAALSNANVRPLVDTGQYRNSTTYVIRKRES